MSADTEGALQECGECEMRHAPGQNTECSSMWLQGAAAERRRIVDWGRSADAVISILNTAIDSGRPVTMDNVVQIVFDRIEEGAHHG